MEGPLITGQFTLQCRCLAASRSSNRLRIRQRRDRQRLDELLEEGWNEPGWLAPISVSRVLGRLRPLAPPGL